jgi:hypothetical protein
MMYIARPPIHPDQLPEEQEAISEFNFFECVKKIREDVPDDDSVPKDLIALFKAGVFVPSCQSADSRLGWVYYNLIPHSLNWKRRYLESQVRESGVPTHE